MKCVDVLGEQDAHLPIELLIERLNNASISEEAKKYCRALLRILRRYTSAISPKDLDSIIMLSSMLDGLSIKNVVTEILARPPLVVEPGEEPN
ncbi:MAG: hypothetical protein GXO07_00830 [Crenarchaeota archaeon]|nr:hypothetical protein [Thermoproteota archaeon]